MGPWPVDSSKPNVRDGDTRGLDETYGFDECHRLEAYATCNDGVLTTAMLQSEDNGPRGPCYFCLNSRMRRKKRRKKNLGLSAEVDCCWVLTLISVVCRADA